MSEKIKEALDAVRPEAGAKERMYANILKKAEKKPKKRPVSLLRYGLPIAACLCLVLLGLARWLPGRPATDPTEGGVQIANPFVDVDSAEAFQSLSITLDAPDGAEDISYAVIDGEMAQVRFTLDGKSYLARATAQTGDFSGLYGQESDPETVDAKTNAVLVSVDVGTGVYQKITWTNGKINYCLYGTDGADKDQVLAAYEALKK